MELTKIQQNKLKYFAWSWSKLASARYCFYQFILKYVDRVPAPNIGIQFKLGELLHLVCEILVKESVSKMLAGQDWNLDVNRVFELIIKYEVELPEESRDFFEHCILVFMNNFSLFPDSRVS